MKYIILSIASVVSIAAALPLADQRNLAKRDCFTIPTGLQICTSTTADGGVTVSIGNRACTVGGDGSVQCITTPSNTTTNGNGVEASGTVDDGGEVRNRTCFVDRRGREHCRGGPRPVRNETDPADIEKRQCQLNADGERDCTRPTFPRHRHNSTDGDDSTDGDVGNRRCWTDRQGERHCRFFPSTATLTTDPATTETPPMETPTTDTPTTETSVTGDPMMPVD